jgi:hypothetical protein
MARPTNSRIFRNSSKYYAPLRKSRGLKAIVQYTTPTLYNPTPLERSRVATTQHLWAYGDRLYKLAYQYYGDQRFWWVIAWYNGYPTEASIPTGATLWIPLNIEKALNVLRA